MGFYTHFIIQRIHAHILWKEEAAFTAASYPILTNNHFDFIHAKRHAVIYVRIVRRNAISPRSTHRERCRRNAKRLGNVLEVMRAEQVTQA